MKDIEVSLPFDTNKDEKEAILNMVKLLRSRTIRLKSVCAEIQGAVAARGENMYTDRELQAFNVADGILEHSQTLEVDLLMYLKVSHVLYVNMPITLFNAEIEKLLL